MGQVLLSGGCRCARACVCPPGQQVRVPSAREQASTTTDIGPGTSDISRMDTSLPRCHSDVICYLPKRVLVR